MQLCSIPQIQLKHPLCVAKNKQTLRSKSLRREKSFYLCSSWFSRFLNISLLKEWEQTGTGFTPAFFLVLELLLFIIIFLAFLIRWYLSASILSDPERVLGAPRRFLDKEEREGKTGNSRLNIISGLCFCTTERHKIRDPHNLKTALLVLSKRCSTLLQDQCETPKELYSEIFQRFDEQYDKFYYYHNLVHRFSKCNAYVKFINPDGLRNWAPWNVITLLGHLRLFCSNWSKQSLSKEKQSNTQLLKPSVHLMV